MKVFLDKNGKEVNVGDMIAFGERVHSQGGRGYLKVGRIQKIDRFVHVDSDYTGLTSGSIIKCTEKFADMFNSGTVFEI